MLRLASRAMGTRFELVLPGADTPARRAAAEAALERVEEWDRRLSLFRSESLVAYVNRNAARAPVRLDADTFELFAVCERMWRDSHGAFDVGLAPRMAALGFHGRPTPESQGDERVPGAAGIELDCERRTVRFRQPGMAVDLGAIGKGHALDDAARVLRELGVSSALLHGGTSTVVAIGAPPDAGAWQVAVEGGSRPEAAPIAQLFDAALSVSAWHGRTLAGAHGEGGHVLDPRTGEPAASRSCCAVVHSSARLADAWSTALVVLGRSPAGADVEAAIGEGPRGARRWRRAGPRTGALHLPLPTRALAPARP